METKRQTELHILTEYSPFSMGFVLITPQNRAIIIDGGYEEEFPNIVDHVGGREVAAWIITHPDGDHITALLHALKTKHPIIDKTEKFIYNFHTLEFSERCGDVAELPIFEEYKAPILSRSINPVVGDEFDIDGLHFEILFSRDERFTENVQNDSSLAFRVTAENRNVLFLGDLGPIAGRVLLAKQGKNLKSDIVQMAHHGHACVEKDVYDAIAPRACIWCCQAWLYREPAIKCYWQYDPDMYGTMMTRQWMQELGVTEHYVTNDGDQIIIL